MVMVCVSSNIASTSLTARNNNEKSVSRRMLLPFAYPSVHNSCDSDHTRAGPQTTNSAPWRPDNGSAKGRPNAEEKPIVFREKADTPLVLPNTNSPSINSHGGRTNLWTNGEGIEQRMLLPEGFSIPEEMYGPNYIWDRKGWPRLVETTPEPEDNYVKISAKKRLHNDSPIVFQEHPHVPLRLPNVNPTQRSQQNNHQNNFLEENTRSRSEMDGLEQRMLLPEGQKIPEKMYGRNYIWDTKGWPRLVGTVPQARRRGDNTSVKSDSKESRIIFG
ncbi:hypothetical protein B7P43_G12461 [Cryptotermes secundus]|uniref:Uncharacterized protein n=2 Tax=Cryptotermes secundus TaxID=105785 RepID=A0A2J7PHA6_9NEOP|nr:hypothetical protein B7P43_G12461 [Cryptotermes secundus]